MKLETVNSDGIYFRSFWRAVPVLFKLRLSDWPGKEYTASHAKYILHALQIFLKRHSRITVNMGRG